MREMGNTHRILDVIPEGKKLRWGLGVCGLKMDLKETGLDYRLD
jgi:hypothetical protein